MREQTKRMLLDEAAKNLRRGAEAVKREEWTTAHRAISSALALVADAQDDGGEWLESVAYAAQTGDESLWTEERGERYEAAIRPS